MFIVGLTAEKLQVLFDRMISQKLVGRLYCTYCERVTVYYIGQPLVHTVQLVTVFKLL